ncbi:coiled-coil domain-containing protein 63-like isoform X2 [Chanos chanos]|nr:coiled-coil domain-containing protein 63-like isoform X2 [Chanos chanos]
MNHPRRERLSDQHTHLLGKSEHYVSLIREQKTHLARLDSKMKEIQERIWVKKREMGGRLYIQKRPRHQIKHTGIMENRINQATTCFDVLLADNQLLREDIDHLRRQRNTLATMFKQLSKETLQQNSEIKKLEEKSVQAYNQRSEALARMLAVKERGKKDTVHYHTEMIELKRVIDHEIKLRRFMEQKSQENILVAENQGAKKKSINFPSFVCHCFISLSTSNSSLRAGVCNKPNEPQQTQHEKTGGDSMETYQAVHTHIMELTGESDLQEIGRKFKDNEKKNFACFSYINVLNIEGTRLRDRINKLMRDTQQFELKNKQHTDRWQGRLHELEAELELRCCRANSLMTQCMLVCKTLDQLRNAMSDLFSKMTCDPSTITARLGFSTEVKDDNADQFLSILEGRVHEWLMVLVESVFKEAEEQELLPQNLLIRGCSLLPSPRSSAAEVPFTASFLDRDNGTVLEQGSEKLMDYQSLCEQVLPQVLHTEQGKTIRMPVTPQRGRKRVGTGGR